MTSSLLHSPLRLGELTLKNRLVMAAMTRSRAVDGNVPSPLALEYYRQRASAGLILSEGTQVSQQGVGYVRTPGIHDAAQVTAWREVTDAVHEAGGLIFAQLWHVGRISHPEFHGGELPIAPSATLPEGKVYSSQGYVPMGLPRALETDEIAGVVKQFEQGARNAQHAGFDGVELHGANGYLLDQFLSDRINVRSDRYGGSLENRARFPLDVVRAVVGVWGASRVAYKISPWGPNAGGRDSDPEATYTYLATELGKLGLGFLEVTESLEGSVAPPTPGARLLPALKKAFGGTVAINGGLTAERAEELLASGEADLASFGKVFLANPDLPERLRRDAPLNAPDQSTFYSGEERGYIDYPKLAVG